MNMKITLLHEEMSQYLEGWKANIDATENQKKIWPQTRKLPQKAIGYDTENCLKLLVEDGFDGQPVGTAPVATARHYFWDNQEHVWIPDRDLIRFGIFFHLNFFKILALVLKGQWERYFSKEMNKNKDGRDLFDILRRSPKDAMELSPRFKPGMNRTSDKKKLYGFFEEHGGLASKAGYDEEKFNILIDQMILSYCYLFGSCSPELDDFIKKQREEQTALLAASDDLNEEFWIKKCSWLELQNDLGNRLLELENNRLKVANVKQKWLETFGRVYLPLLEAESAFHSLQRRIQLKLAVGPAISRDEIEKLEQEQKQEEEKKLTELKYELEKAMMISAIERTPKYLNGAERTDYEKECKNVLREIYKHAHPDSTSHYRFTQDQKEKLRQYFEQAIEIRAAELGGDFRQLDVLCSILASVKSLWENMGMDVREDSVIQGSTLVENFQWLEERIQKLEEEIRMIKAENHALLIDAEYKERQACMISPEQITQTTKQMEEKLKEYKDQAALLETQFNALFEDGGTQT
ncbi:MAG: hypothetical protein WC347_06480 [Smithellaceae bacterium]